MELFSLFLEELYINAAVAFNHSTKGKEMKKETW